MRSLTLREARNKVDDMFPIDENINDETLEDQLTDISKWVDLRNQLDDLEIKFGVDKLETRLWIIEHAIGHLDTLLSVNRHKLDPSLVSKLQSDLDTYKNDASDLSIELDKLLDTIEIEDSFFEWR